MVEQPISRTMRTVVVLAGIVGLLTLYMVAGYLRPPEIVPVQLPIFIDEVVPFSLFWLPLYVFMLPMSWSPACAIADRRMLRRWAVSLLIMYVIAVPVWMFWPVTVPRLDVPVDGFWSYALWILRECDPPVNCLPSMHVAVATLAGLVVRRVDRKVGRLILMLMPFIWYSTMALDQHWFIDGLAGMMLAVFADQIGVRLMPVPEAATGAIPRVWHLAWIGPYLVVLVSVFAYWLVAVA